MRSTPSCWTSFATRRVETLAQVTVSDDRDERPLGPAPRRSTVEVIFLSSIVRHL